ncbi:MAG: DNA-processing protein DprA [Bacteroidales bacterium]|jgi:DNA processing protein|nr:DNA-processing protein DprA [Bacteroidales bacterium]MCI1733774.1 DNA-processing protein DprA [Bacteroidales bacterium]
MNENYLCALSKVFFNNPVAGRALLELYPTVKEIFEADDETIDNALCRRGSGAKLHSKGLLDWAEKEALWYEEKKVRIIDISSKDYPQKLLDCQDAPFVLYFKGNGNLNNARSLGVVGTRLASLYGSDSCKTLISSFSDNAYNPLIVSGLAIGIDITAHRAALENGMETVAVLPCGIDLIYPASHRDDAIKMISGGGILTEFPRETPALRRNFLQRNRIIAGMTQGLLVAETRVYGGSMSTVEYASSYGREIFAVPGRICDANSYGCNYLISKNVASACINTLTIPVGLGWTKSVGSDVSLQQDLFSSSNGKREKILLTLSPVIARGVDYVVQNTGYDFNTASLILLELELEGEIVADDKGEYKLKRRNRQDAEDNG